MAKEEKAEAACLLGIRPGDPRGKCPMIGECQDCGWNPEIDAARRLRIRAGILANSKSGTKYLKIYRR